MANVPAAIQFDDRFFGDQLLARADRFKGQANEALVKLRNKTCRGAEWTGWFDFPARTGFTLAHQIKRLTADIDVHFDLVVVIGIGGSYLGTRAIAEALGHEYQAYLPKQNTSGLVPIVYAGHHLSEAGLLELLDLLEKRQPMVNVISKTGTTTEPSIAFRVIRGYLERRYGAREAARRIIATTDKDHGALRRLAGEKNYRTFEVPSDIGGRFSVLSAVGLVPLALGGFGIERLLEGADEVFAGLRDEQPNALQDAVVRYAACRHAAHEAGKTAEVLNFSEPKLRSFIEWWKQLFGESEGKEGKGLLPVGFASTTDLHSLGQYVQDGVRNLMETFLVFDQGGGRDSLGAERRLRLPHVTENTDELGYLENRLISDVNTAASQGTKVAHFEGGVPCLELRTGVLNEHTLGALIAFFESTCAVSGALLGVNPFDQPGVEAYKKNLFGLLGKPGFEQLGAELRRRL